MASPLQNSNFNAFSDCLSAAILQRSAAAPSKVTKKQSRRRRKDTTTSLAREEETERDGEKGAETMEEFVLYLATEIFDSFPEDLQNLSYSVLQKDARLASKYTDPLPESLLDSIIATVPPSVPESLETYGLLSSHSDTLNFLKPILQDYINAASAAPPIWSTTRASACEICERSWIPLTYHHLIPKQMHAKAIKRGWHEEWRLNSVAWLCRACHSFVHRTAGNEELAKDLWTVDRLLQRDDVVAWAKWVGRVRWKAQ